MSQYQCHIKKIDETMVATAKKVEDVSTTMNTKVDNLQLIMKTFIEIMSKVVTPFIDDSASSEAHESLKLLTQLLEEEDKNNAPMDCDSEDTMMEHTPIQLSLGVDNTLSGESNS